MSAWLPLILVVAGLWLVDWLLDSKDRPGIDDFIPGVILMQALGGIVQYAAPFFLVAVVLHLPHVLAALAVTGSEVGRSNIDLRTALLVLTALIPFALQGALGFGCSAPLRGRRSTYGQIVGAAPLGLLRTLPTVLAVGLAVAALPSLAWVASKIWAPTSVGLAVFALLAPLVVQAHLALAVPAAWAERLGPLAAMRRSRQLTRGHRGRLGVMVLALLLASVVSLVAAVRLTPEWASRLLEVRWTFGAIAVVGSSYGLLYAVSTWIIYERLRRREGGGAPDPGVVAVFE